jgi:hypothetical protein
MRIFLSYRRDDASGHAGRLYDALSARFGAENVFMDIDTIDLGADFVEVITEAVASCDVLIALLGQQWLSATDAEGRRQLDNPDDFVRIELEAALERDVFVIPACVQGAPQPSSEQLPEILAPLARRHGAEIRDVGWHDDVRRLIERLERLEGERSNGASSQQSTRSAEVARAVSFGARRATQSRPRPSGATSVRSSQEARSSALGDRRASRHPPRERPTKGAARTGCPRYPVFQHRPLFRIQLLRESPVG